MLRVLVVVVIASLALRASAQPPPDGAGTPPDGTGAPDAAQPDPDAGSGTAPTPPDTTGASMSSPPTNPDPAKPAAGPNRFPMGWRLMISDLTIFRLNPIGLETRSRIGIQKKLYPSTKKVTENNFFFLGAFPKLNPASAQFSLGGEIQPASIFNLRVYYELQQFFGTFGFLQSFTSANANYSDNRLATLKDDPGTEPESKLVKHFSVQPQLMLRAGPIVLRSLLQLDHWSFSTRNDLIYEPTFDTLLPNNGWTMSTDTDLLYVPGGGTCTSACIAAGLRHTYVRPMYDDNDHFANTGDANAYDGQNAHHRIGFFGAYTFKDEGPSRFNKPTVILIVSFYMKHKYRAGEPGTLDPDHTADDYRTRAFPYFIAGFAFESDFLAIRQ